MDPMDIDDHNNVDVPDTPERLTTRVTVGENYPEKKHLGPPIPFRVEKRSPFEGCSKDKPILIESGSKRPPLHLHKPINYRQQAAFSLDASPPQRNLLFRKGGLAENSRLELRKKPGLVNGASGFGNTEVSEFVADSQNKPVNNGDFVSRSPIASPLNKQKRLVRNGCISPHNIAMAKKLDVRDTNCPSPSKDNHGLVASTSPCSPVNINDLVAEVGDSHRRKGKGILTQPCSYREPALPHKNLCIRSSMECDEKDVGKGECVQDASKGIEGSVGWRTTRNKSREIDVLPINVARETDESSRFLGDKTGRKGKGLSSDPKLISSVNVCPKDSGPYSTATIGQHNRHHSAMNKHVKRKKQGSTSSSVGECSTLVSDDREAMVLNQEADPRSTSINRTHAQPTVEIDEFSPQSRCHTRDEEAKARQLEADEMLARELQEQFYNEAPIQGVGEVDQHLALASQRRDVSEQGSRPARHSRSRGSFVSELRRQARSSTNSTAARRGSLARASSTLGGMARSRIRFPGQPRSLLSSSGSTSMFPADMDVELRMHILGALEEFTDMNAGILHTHRDFTEDDYEMLLALDENNNFHSGASNMQINGLPQSTVQNDNFEESCAICLETPAMGDTIRHLPCLHKFHKDCIDPWLRRRTSCPICKSSIT